MRAMQHKYVGFDYGCQDLARRAVDPAQPPTDALGGGDGLLGDLLERLGAKTVGRARNTQRRHNFGVAVIDRCGDRVQDHLEFFLRAGPPAVADRGQLGFQIGDLDFRVRRERLEPGAQPLADVSRLQPGQQHLSARRRMRGTTLADPGAKGDAGGTHCLGDVHDAVLVQNGQVGRLAHVGRERVARALTLLHEVKVPAARPCEPGNRKAQAVFATIGQLLDVATRLEDSDQSRHRRLVHAELRRDLGHTRLPQRGQDLHYQQCAIYRLHRGGPSGGGTVPSRHDHRAYTAGMPKLPTRRCTAAISRNPSLSRLRFSGDRSDIVTMSSGLWPTASWSTWCVMRSRCSITNTSVSVIASRSESAPVAAAAVSRAGVDAEATSAVSPPHRARLTIGVSAWLFRSNVPPRRDNTSRSERARTRPDNASSSCSRRALGCSARIRRYAAGTVCNAPSPHTTRPSISKDDITRPRSRSGSSSHVWAALAQSVSEREKFGFHATAPLRSDGSPQSSRMVWVRRAIARSCALAEANSSDHDSALSTSEEGIASRRAMLPSVSHAKPALGAAPDPTSASSSALRTRLSKTMDRMLLVAEAFVPLRTSSPATPGGRRPHPGGQW